MYTGLRGAASGELPVSGTLMRITLYPHLVLVQGSTSVVSCFSTFNPPQLIKSHPSVPEGKCSYYGSRGYINKTFAIFFNISTKLLQ